MAKLPRTAQSDLDGRWSAVESSAKSESPYRKQFSAAVSEKSIDETARTVRFVITTGGVDRDNDTINPGGWEMAEFLRSPSILWAHDYSLLPVARALDITASGTGLESTAQFPPKGIHAFADTVFDLIKLGIINACSVGFKPLEYSRDDERGGINFQRQSLLEWSIVPVPANAEALVVARSKGVDVAPLLKWAEDTMDKYGTHPGRKAGLVGALDAPEAKTAAPCPKCGKDAYDGDTCSACGYQRAAADEEDPEMAARSVPPAGTGTGALCPACGSAYDGKVCAGCGWQSPAANPITVDAPVVGAAFAPATLMDADLRNHAGRAVAIRGAEHEPAYVEVSGAGRRTRTYRTLSDDPIRWNRQHSKAFDVAGEPLEPSKLEIAWVSRYLETPVQDLSVETFVVSSARMGSFLAAYDEGLGAWQVDACRSMTESGREVPPEYEAIQLNSRTTRSFLVEGLRFMQRAADHVKIVSKIQRAWSGVYVTNYIRHEQASARTEWTQRVWQRAGELNYLRGEAFTLSGEFLDRGDLDWPALFLDADQETVLRRTVERINEHGAAMESRGLMLMGPPGTGKTLTGRVMMRQADTTFIWVSARDFYRSGAFGAFTYAFDIAQECAPSIIFFEDVDNWLGADTVDLLKTEMDGLKRRKGVETILTTNFPELIPDALIDRPGRFHDLLELGLPTPAVRQRMLAAWVPGATVEERTAVADATAGFSGAHLRELANYAGVIQSEEPMAIGAALTRALEKLQAQRALVDALREAPDYRPRRQIRAMVGTACATVAKRGRVLSAANEGRIRQAQEHLTGVLAQLNRQPPPEETPEGETDDAKELVVTLVEADPVETIVLTLADDDPAVFMVDPDEIKAAIKTTVAETLRTIIRDATSTALARRAGRVD